MIHNLASNFYLSRPSKSGKGTIGQEFEAVSRMRGKRHKELDFPSMPHIFAPLRSVYSDLQGGELTYQEFKAYCEMTGTRLDAFDLGIIKDMDFVRKCSANGMKVQEILEAFNYG